MQVVIGVMKALIRTGQNPEAVGVRKDGAEKACTQAFVKRGVNNHC